MEKEDSLKLKIAKKVRKSLEKYGVENNFPSNLSGLCAIAALTLAKAFLSHGIKAEVVYGDYIKPGALTGHCWVVSGKKLFDVTATQFGLPKIFVIQRRDQILYHYDPIKKIDLSSYEDAFSHWTEQTKPLPDRIEDILKQAS